MRGAKGQPGRREADDERATGGDTESLEYEEDDLPDLIMNIEDDVLDDRENEDAERAPSDDRKTRVMFMALAITGLLACVVLICLVAYFATTYVGASEDLQVARDNLQNTTESYLKLQQQAKHREQLDCTRFKNTTEHWLHLFCEKYECPSRICDPGWLLFSRSCFLLTNTRLSWEQSKDLCLSKHGHLAIANHDQVQNFLFEQAKEMAYWIGMSDSLTEGNWIWMDGSKVKDGITFWGPGQPDNVWNRTYRTAENCGLMRQRQWFDEACGAKYPAACEKNAIRLHLIFQRMMRLR
ncbi:C-type lectin domain family 6 member A-like [Scyliorhinus canicula]|uniref:C-type lectin domain family 6 member A-like n=1 Tax=Scyliorhinus canicula TaxID=7830 RepID=UPI0018F6DB4C|nr:C-type lectin domain family 6 member A-like [Scyliorhinus canicula]